CCSCLYCADLVLFVFPVRQNFAVLEDGVLAHSLQEQEIEQFYTTNVQKNQLVQNDIRVAKRLQDEEEEQRAQYSALLRQTSRQMEERDFEYARVIQEEIRRRAEEARRREMDDEVNTKTHQSRSVRDRTSLELGELQQVLHDEELARKLQEEEEKVQSRSPGPSPRSSCPDGDFAVAQVAQDEEIARYMQKQEITWKRRSRELDGPASWREHRAMMSQHDRRARDRQVNTLHQTASQIRNIAEELDPTFPGRSSENLRGEQTGSCCAPLPQSGFQDEPTFIPPTKRQAEKSVRPKSKEKRENCKQQ
uniref:Coiled-coil domain-containing protein n=1 Tax=Periophthalmus magnuspinnatus TaxID=409849 RepID=A0A3B4APD4_9GOBI